MVTSPVCLSGLIKPYPSNRAGRRPDAADTDSRWIACGPDIRCRFSGDGGQSGEECLESDFSPLLRGLGLIPSQKDKQPATDSEQCRWLVTGLEPHSGTKKAILRVSGRLFELRMKILPPTGNRLAFVPQNKPSSLCLLICILCPPLLNTGNNAIMRFTTCSPKA